MRDFGELDCPDCAELRRVLEERTDGRLPAEGCHEVDAHLSCCSDCREYRDELLLIREELRRLPLIPLPDDVVIDVLGQTVDREPVVVRRVGSLSKAAALVLAVTIPWLAWQRSEVTAEAELTRAVSQTCYVLGTTARALRRVEHAAVEDVFQKHFGAPLNRLSSEWLERVPQTLRRPGT